MAKENLEILVVEDREENRKAAQAYFNSREDVNVNFVTNYDKGLEKLGQEKYDFAILDLEIPREEGTKPEKLGFSLAEEAEKYTIPWAVITAGFYAHGRSNSSFVQYSWKGIPNIEEIEKAIEKESALDSLSSFGFEIIRGVPKTNPGSWKKVYETLLNPFEEKGLKPIYWALKRINSRNPTKVLLTSMGRLARESLARR